MDQKLKQRLVGAVVVTLLAAIFIPMLFDDPVDDTSKMINELKVPKFPVNSINTETIQLPENINEVIDLPKPDALKQLDSTQATKHMVRWFIQVGIFGEESNAEALQNKLRRQGFSVIITKQPSDKGFLYRVRVGPELDKRRAEQQKIKLDKLNSIKSILSSVEN